MSDTSRGWIFDLVNGIANDLATTNHLHENLYDAYSKVKEGEEGAMDEFNQYKKLLLMALENRRSKMRILKETTDDFNDKLWCPLKHTIESYMEAMEVWQATQTAETLVSLHDSTSLLAGVLSMALGMELESCARCLNDILKEVK